MKPPISATAIAVLFVLLGAQAADAHEFSALIKAKKYAETERAANARLAADPHSADALIAKVDLIMIRDQESRLDDAVKLAEQCIAAHPQRSECHESLGNALGTKAVTTGIFSALGYAGKIRDTFQKAVELDPRNFDARFSLMQYYLQAPGIVGGGKDKAQALAVETGKVNATAGTLMQALLDLVDDKSAKAEAAALAVNTSGIESLLNAQRDVLVGVGSKYMQEKKFADSERLFREVQRRFPDSEWGSFGLARTLQEQGKNTDAIVLFEKALAIEPRATIYYRMAQCWQAVSEKTKAVAAFEKALTIKPGLGKKQKSDAEDQLKTLKG